MMILGGQRTGSRRIENRSMSFCLKLTLTRVFQCLITNNSLSMKEAIPRSHLTPKPSSKIKTKSSQLIKPAILLNNSKEPTYRHTTKISNYLKVKVTIWNHVKTIINRILNSLHKELISCIANSRPIWDRFAMIMTMCNTWIRNSRCTVVPCLSLNSSNNRQPLVCHNRKLECLARLCNNLDNRRPWRATIITVLRSCLRPTRCS